jgi:hypothetical protein
MIVNAEGQGSELHLPEITGSFGSVIDRGDRKTVYKCSGLTPARHVWPEYSAIGSCGRKGNTQKIRTSFTMFEPIGDHT